MPIYRCYFFDQSGSIKNWEPLDCETDAEAGELATELLGEHAYHHAVEVWDLSRKAFHHARKIALGAVDGRC